MPLTAAEVRDAERATLRAFMDGFEPAVFGATLRVDGVELEQRWRAVRKIQEIATQSRILDMHTVRERRSGEEVLPDADIELTVLRRLYECWAPIGSSIYLRAPSAELRSLYEHAKGFRS